MKDYVVVRYARFAAPDEPCEPTECVMVKAKSKRKAATGALWIFSRDLDHAGGDELGSVYVMRIKSGKWYDPALKAVKSALQCCGGLAAIGTFDRPDRHTGSCTEAPDEEKGL